MRISIAFGICLLLLWSWQRAERLGVPWFSLGGKQTRKPQLQRRQRRQSESSKLPREIFPTRAFHQLHQLTHDAETAERLVKRLSEKHPGRDMLWCIQKAIYDIERDRQAR